MLCIQRLIETSAEKKRLTYYNTTTKTQMLLCFYIIGIPWTIKEERKIFNNSMQIISKLLNLKNIKIKSREEKKSVFHHVVH